MIGELDLSAELGIEPSNTDALLPLRMQVVVVSAALGLEPPLGPVSPDFRDLEGLRRESELLAGLGVGSRPAIHPAQVAVFNEVFSPSAEAVAEAGRLVELYEAALAEGRGAVTDDDGHMVDEAVVRVARRIMARATSTVRDLS
jgi:citrate lyase subunit beta/citryl-CoA lyase